KRRGKLGPLRGGFDAHSGRTGVFPQPTLRSEQPARGGGGFSGQSTTANRSLVKVDISFPMFLRLLCVRNLRRLSSERVSMIETFAVYDDYAAAAGAVCAPGQPIERCGSCSTPVLLRRPSASTPASPWLCRRCGSVFFARPQEQDGKLLRGVAKPICYHDVMRELNVHLGAGSQTASRRDVMRLVECF